jgi:hypothetical protein
MKNRIFKHFPPEAKCPICGKSDDSECFIIPIDGTEKERLCEAQPVHVTCITDDLRQFRYNRKLRCIYVMLRLS